MLFGHTRGREPFEFNAVRNSHLATVRGSLEVILSQPHEAHITRIAQTCTDTKENMYRTVRIFCMGEGAVSVRFPTTSVLKHILELMRFGKWERVI